MGVSSWIAGLILGALVVLKILAIIACGCGIAGFVAWKRKWFRSTPRHNKHVAEAQKQAAE